MLFQAEQTIWTSPPSSLSLLSLLLCFSADQQRIVEYAIHCFLFVFFFCLKAQSHFIQKQVPLLRPFPLSGSPMEVWTAAATAKNKIQAREHRGSEPTSTRSCLSRPGLLLPTVPGAASGGLRKEPDLSQTMSQSSLQHTFLCSLLSDSILTERKKLRSHLIYSRQPRSLPPTFTEHISGTSNPRFLEITPRAQPGPPVSLDSSTDGPKPHVQS